MNNMFPENSYSGTCSCGVTYLAPKGTLHCSNCLYKRIAELEKALSHAETASTKERDIRDLEQQAKGLYGNDIPINIDFRKLEDRVLAMSKKEDLNLGDL